MFSSYGKIYSRYLGREMEYMQYGTSGKPVLILPCQGGRFTEFEEMGMLKVYAPFIEDGRIQVFTIDSIDNQTLLAPGDPRGRIVHYEAWVNFVIGEAVPFFSRMNTQANGWQIRFMSAGISLGSLHASNLFFLFPDTFDALLALSGIYTNERSFGCYHDDLTYNNAPLQYLGGMPCGHPYIEKYNRSRIVLCVGRGAWEVETLEDTRAMAAIFRRKGIDAWVDFWGDDVCHDWNWWYLQAAYFLPLILG